MAARSDRTHLAAAGRRLAVVLLMLGTAGGGTVVAAEPPAASTATGTADDVPGAETDVADLSGLHRQLVDRVAARDWAPARRTLDRIRRRLPADHLTRLRLEGWYAMRHGDDAEALRHYGRVRERLPGDEEAVINLMHVHLRAGDVDRARVVLEQARTHAPASATFRRLARELGL